MRREGDARRAGLLGLDCASQPMTAAMGGPHAHRRHLSPAMCCNSDRWTADGVWGWTTVYRKSP